MRGYWALLSFAAIALMSGAAQAAECPGNPDAIGTSRVLVVDPSKHPRLGTMQYHYTLPLADKEVVLTFDDGPLPPYSNRILDILAANCVKATYFIVGRQAQAYPAIVRRIYAEGHTIGTHSQNHPFTFKHMDVERVKQEVDQGIASTAAALGNPKEVAPFFRIPGLARGPIVEKFLADQHIMTWSADFPADDWRHISASEIIRRAMRRLEAKGKGILLLHDIHPATVIALPGLLKELKQRGYHIVQVVPAGPGRPATPTERLQWVLHILPSDIFPEPDGFVGVVKVALPAPSPRSFGIDLASGLPALLHPVRRYERVRFGRRHRHVRWRLVSPWPRTIEPSHELSSATSLPIPAADNFRLARAELPAFAAAAVLPKPVTGHSRGAARLARHHAKYFAQAPIVPIVSRNESLPVVHAVHHTVGRTTAAMSPPPRHGPLPGRWPVPSAERLEPARP
jgi:peptidoglycan-N-acetylglucosamine deacetylase